MIEQDNIDLQNFFILNKTDNRYSMFSILSNLSIESFVVNIIDNFNDIFQINISENMRKMLNREITFIMSEPLNPRNDHYKLILETDLNGQDFSNETVDEFNEIGKRVFIKNKKILRAKKNNNIFISPLKINYKNYPEPLDSVDLINDIKYTDNKNEIIDIQIYNEINYNTLNKEYKENIIDKQKSTAIYDIRKNLSGTITDYLINKFGNLNILFNQLKYIIVVYDIFINEYIESFNKKIRDLSTNMSIKEREQYLNDNLLNKYDINLVYKGGSVLRFISLYYIEKILCIDNITKYLYDGYKDENIPEDIIEFLKDVFNYFKVSDLDFSLSINIEHPMYNLLFDELSIYNFLILRSLALIYNNFFFDIYTDFLPKKAKLEELKQDDHPYIWYEGNVENCGEKNYKIISNLLKDLEEIISSEIISSKNDTSNIIHPLNKIKYFYLPGYLIQCYQENKQDEKGNIIKDKKGNIILEDKFKFLPLLNNNPENYCKDNIRYCYQFIDYDTFECNICLYYNDLYKDYNITYIKNKIEHDKSIYNKIIKSLPTDNILSNNLYYYDLLEKHDYIKNNFNNQLQRHDYIYTPEFITYLKIIFENNNYKIYNEKSNDHINSLLLSKLFDIRNYYYKVKYESDNLSVIPLTASYNNTLKFEINDLNLAYANFNLCRMKMNSILIYTFNNLNKNYNHSDIQIKNMMNKYIMLKVYSEFYDIGISHLSDYGNLDYYKQNINTDMSSVDDILEHFIDKTYINEGIEIMMINNNNIKIKKNFLNDIRNDNDEYYKDIKLQLKYGNNLVSNNLYKYVNDTLYPKIYSRVENMEPRSFNSIRYKKYYMKHYDLVSIFNIEKEDNKKTKIFIQNEDHLLNELLDILYNKCHFPWQDKKYSKRLYRYIFITSIYLLSNFYIDEEIYNKTNKLEFLSFYINTVNNINFQIYNIFNKIYNSNIQFINEFQKYNLSNDNDYKNFVEYIYKIYKYNLEHINYNIISFKKEINIIILFIQKLYEIIKIYNPEIGNITNIFNINGFFTNLIKIINNNYHIQTNFCEDILYMAKIYKTNKDAHINEYITFIEQYNTYTTNIHRASLYSLRYYQMLLHYYQYKDMNLIKKLSEPTIDLKLDSNSIYEIFKNNTETRKSKQEFIDKSKELKDYKPIIVKNQNKKYYI